MGIEEFTDVFRNSTEYDELDHKFKLVCNKGVQEVLHYITKFGLNNTAITEQQALSKIAERFPAGTDQLVKMLESTEALSKQDKFCTLHLKSSLPTQPELVEVPEFVAEYLEMRKEKYPVGGLGGAILTVFDGGYPEVSNWMNNNVEVFARAWLDGYTVKKEPTWVVAITDSESFSGTVQLNPKGEVYRTTYGNLHAVKFTDKAKAEAVALLIGGEAVPVEEEPKLPHEIEVSEYLEEEAE